MFSSRDSNVTSLEDHKRAKTREPSELIARAGNDAVDSIWEHMRMPEPRPVTTEEAKQSVAREVDASRPRLLAAFKAADRDGLRDFQRRLAAVIDEVDRVQRDLADVGHGTNGTGKARSFSGRSGAVSDDAGVGLSLPPKLGASPSVGADADTGSSVSQNEGGDAA